jgi:hypothetical protein
MPSNSTSLCTLDDWQTSDPPLDKAVSLRKISVIRTKDGDYKPLRLELPRLASCSFWVSMSPMLMAAAVLSSRPSPISLYVYEKKGPMFLLGQCSNRHRGKH